ncbi:VWA domain-containing protein [Piscibacillus salipiscarius]|uniref:VWA domain-containing protein n=2 Tax=Piscibacillus salipiscarius TaxID=299480 RepID=A0ABW5Q9U4_9BACI
MKLKPLYVLLIVLFISGCSNSDSTKPHPEDSDPEIENETVTTSDQDQEESNETEDVKESQDEEPEITLEELDPIPTNVEGLASQSPGRFANADSIYDLDQEIKEAMQDVGPMSKNPTDEEYERFLRKMYWLVAQDYPNPEDVIKKWEFASFGNPDLPDTKFHFKENYNVEVILDSSGSMANPAGNGTRMDVAKKSIKEFLSEVPEEANVSLRVYGHKGTGADSDKEMSCNAIEQVYGFNIYNEDKFKKSLNQFKPMGWTPLADALKQSQEALSQFDAKKNTNLIYVVSDGIETCDGDPIAVAKELSKSNAQPIINIIGFQTDAEAQKQLEMMAEVSGGIFASASNEEELQKEFDRAEKVLESWNQWKDDAMYDIEVQETDNYFDILGISNDWYFTTLGVDNNLHSFADVLEEIEFITYEQSKELKNRISTVMEKIEETGNQLEKDMEEISEKSLQEAKKMVEQKYKSQTSEE